MARLSRKDMEARYELFNIFSLDDQRKYYQSTVKKHRLAASQVNRIRAAIAFFTGVAAAAAGFIVQSSFISGARCSVTPAPADCGNLEGLVTFLVIMAVVLPALGAFFNTLADLYQWDRMITIYESALENIEVADAQSPMDDMDDLIYRSSLRAFTEGTLQVMSDETAQWGQSIRTPATLEQFIEEERQKSARIGGDASEHQIGRTNPPNLTQPRDTDQPRDP